MADFNVPENPVYNSKIRKLEPTDPAHADLFNNIFQQLIENVEAVKKNLYGIEIITNPDIDLLDDIEVPVNPGVGTGEIATNEDIDNLFK